MSHQRQNVELTFQEKLFVNQAWEQYLITTENAVTVEEVVLALLEYRATLDHKIGSSRVLWRIGPEHAR